MTPAVADWHRVSRSRPCPICQHPDWCTVTGDGSIACCMRIESPKQVRNGGWLHRLRDSDDWQQRRYARRIVLAARRVPAADFYVLAERYRAAMNPFDLVRLAAELGVSRSALWRLGVGWDGAALAFPMLNAAGIVTGIRRRFPDGRKLSVRGGHEGLFVPSDLPAAGLLLVCEGPTDTAAMLTLGFPAVGRPSCRGGAELVGELARGRPVVIVADGDEPGRLGAEALAVVLARLCPMVRVIRPPDGVKDARQWLQRGATARDVRAAIDAAEPIRFGIKTRAAGR